MLALRLTRGAQPAVQLRRFLVAAASAGTGFLLLCALGYAMAHPSSPGASLLRLAWCTAPLAATVYFAVAVARTDPATRPRPGLSAIGLGPLRLMAFSATTTALSSALGSMLALLFFLHLRGDLTGMPFDGAAAEFLAAGRPLPLPGALTLLAVVPVTASGAVALVLRPREAGRAPARGAAARRYGRFGAYGLGKARETFGAYGRFGRHVPSGRRDPRGADGGTDGAGTDGGGTEGGAAGGGGANGSGTDGRGTDGRGANGPGTDGRGANGRGPDGRGANGRGANGRGTDGESVNGRGADDTPPAPGSDPHPPVPAQDVPDTYGASTDAPSGLPWGIAILAAGLAVETYASRTAPALTTPGDLADGRPGVLVGWVLTALGLALAGPGLTHLCGRLLQSVRPGALRLLAGRILMAEAVRVGRPLGVVCAVASAMYAMASLYDPHAPSLGPLTTLGVLLVTGCTVATLLTAAVEARHARAETTAALLRLGAPAATLRGAAALRAGALLALFGPLTLIVAELAALPLAR